MHKDEPALHEQTPSERSQGEMERAQRLRCGKQTKTEWWDTECMDSRPGVSWMETVVTESGKYGSGGSQHVLS